MSTTFATNPPSAATRWNRTAPTAGPTFAEFSPFPMSASHRRTWMPRADGQHPALV